MKKIFVICSALVFLNCGNSEPTVEQIAQQQRLKQLVESKDYQIESDRAMPQASNSLMQIQNTGILGVGNTAGNINLIGNPNYLTISGDSVKAQLPFFGERQMGGGYGGRDAGIEFDGLMEDYSSEWIERKGRYVVRFNADSQNEQYMVVINLFPNMTTSMMVNGNQHTPIRYSGYVKKVDSKNSEFEVEKEID